jgi:hypothetical protein
MTQHKRGGYESSSRPASELAAPPRGPAPGARIYRSECPTLCDDDCDAECL